MHSREWWRRACRQLARVLCTATNLPGSAHCHTASSSACHPLVRAARPGITTDAWLCAQLFTRRTARLLFGNLRLQRWCFDVELVYLARRFKVPIVEENVNWDEVPGTKIQWWAPLSMGRDLVLVKAAYATGAWVAHGEQSAAAS
jgi:dolichyl-phosphate beta-glucosyltransferase